MADSSKVLLKAVIAALLADSAISTIVSTRVYSSVPQNETFPYIVVSVASAPFDTKDITGMQHTLQVSGFSRTNRSPEEAFDIKVAAYNLLNRGENNITLDSGNLVSMLFSGVGFVLKEEDGITWQGSSQFDVIIDE